MSVGCLAAGRLPVSSIDHFWGSAEIGGTLGSGRKAIVSMGYYFAPHTIKGGQAVWEDVRRANLATDSRAG